MPIYVIECRKCGFTEEKLFNSYRNLDDYVCPECGIMTWIKKPCNTNWRLSRKLLHKTNADQLDREGIVVVPHGQHSWET